MFSLNPYQGRVKSVQQGTDKLVKFGRNSETACLAVKTVLV